MIIGGCCVVVQINILTQYHNYIFELPYLDDVKCKYSRTTIELMYTAKLPYELSKICCMIRGLLAMICSWSFSSNHKTYIATVYPPKLPITTKPFQKYIILKEWERQAPVPYCAFHFIGFI